MHAAANPKIYTEAMAVRLTPEALLGVHEAAKAQGVRPAEWLRGVITRELQGDSNTRMILAELMDLRAILLTLQTDGWRDVEFTEAQLREMVAKSGARKFAAADRVMLEAKQG